MTTSEKPARTGVMLITGASRGIGAATARLAAAAGCAVCVNFHRDAQAAGQVVDAVRQEGGRAFAVQADVTVEDDVVHLFTRCDEAFGRLTALVNNAGVLGSLARVDAMQSERLRTTFSTNISGAFLCAREAVRRMSTAHGGAGGAIVNVSSRAACFGAGGEYVDYAASKAALDALTRGLAQEVADEGVRVNAVRPGFIETAMHDDTGDPDRRETVRRRVPMGRLGTPDEVAQTILWLLSEQASYVTGALLDVAGGR